MNVWVGLPVNHESFAGDHQTLIDRYIQISQIDTAMEARGEGFNNTRAQQGSRVARED